MATQTSALDFCETDSEDQLPSAWEERVDDKGNVYYANHESASTTWYHPITGKTKTVSGKLPFGWEKKICEDGGVVYIDTIHGRQTYTDPRLVFAQGDRRSKRQKYDGSSTALEILMSHDVSDKYVIITGSTSGIGYETARSLSLYGAYVVLACRNLERGEEKKAQILSERPQARVKVMSLNLASLSSVKRFAEEYINTGWPLDILVLNAAVLQGYELTEDGLDMTFQVNYLAHFYLALVLKDKLALSRPSRVIHLSSESHRWSKTLDINKLTIEDFYERPTAHGSLSSYSMSKLCNVLCSKEMHRRWGNEYGVTSVSLHPGNMIATSLPRSSIWLRVAFFFVRPFTKSLQQGAATTVYCCVVDEVREMGGEYFNNCCACPTSKMAQDENLAAALWKLSLNLLKCKGFEF